MMSPRFTRAGIRRGIILTLPLAPGVVVFGMGFGTVAAKTGLSLTETLAMSAFMFAGASQFVALAAWQPEWTLATVATAVILVVAVNSRLILMGASLRPWFEPLPRAQAYSLLGLNTDATWILSLRSEAETGQRDVGVFLGIGVFLWVLWLVATAPGWWLGALIRDPKVYALDLVTIVFFSAMLVPLWKGARAARPWFVAAAVAVTMQAVLPGYGYIVLGAIAGALTGALTDE